MIFRLLPATWIRWIARLAFKLPLLRPFVRLGTRYLKQKEHVIAHGIGKGLRFNPSGSMPGYALGTADWEEQQVLAAWLTSGQVFYDIGANVGFFSILAARLVRPAGKVYAFEPFPGSAEAIRRNAALNHFDQTIEVWEGAVSDYTGSGRLRVGKLCNAYKLQETEEAEQQIEVPVYAIDDLVRHNHLQPPDFVKIDVEGHEIHVLQGMQETIQRYRPVILCEVHWLKEEIEALLQELFIPLGYRATQIDGRPLPDRAVRYHLLLVPSERIAPKAHVT